MPGCRSWCWSCKKDKIAAFLGPNTQCGSQSLSKTHAGLSPIAGPAPAKCSGEDKSRERSEGAAGRQGREVGFALSVRITRHVLLDEMTGDQRPEQANYSHLIMGEGGNAGSACSLYDSLGSIKSITSF